MSDTVHLSPTIFREYDVRGLADQDLTEEAVARVARALGTRVRKVGGRRVVLGRDCRVSGERFAKAALAGLTSTGVDVHDLGVAPTPLAWFTAFTLDTAGLLVVTGSHNPPEYNGLKLAVGRNPLYSQEIQDLKKLAENGPFATGSGRVTTHDAVRPYQEYVRQNLSLGPRQLTVVVDAGNGTGGVVAVPLFRSLGVEVIPLFLEPDGRFPNHHADPTVEDNLTALRQKVLDANADLGIAYDGDADRVGAVDERGRPMWGDQLMILFARALLEERPGAAIVGEVKCSASMYADIARNGGRPVMWRAGHSLIRAKMKEEGALLAGEMSGHIFFADRWFGFDDGIYASGRLLELLSRTDRPLSALLADVPRMYASPEIRVACPEALKFEVVKRAQAWFSERYEAVTVDGVRVNFPDGWGLVRASNTQPLLVLRFEAGTEERLHEIQALVTAKVEELKLEVGAA